MLNESRDVMTSYHSFISTVFPQTVTREQIYKHFAETFKDYQYQLECHPLFNADSGKRFVFIHFQDIKGEDEILQKSCFGPQGTNTQLFFLTARFLTQPQSNDSEHAKPVKKSLH